jgi:type IV pilus assembly protein PilY1
MARNFRNSTFGRSLAAGLAALIGLGPMLTPAYAQLTTLADQPFGAQARAKPNIMLTVDDSSSMLYDFLPDSVIGKAAGPNNYCRDVTGKMNAQCGLFDIAIDLTAQGRGRDVSPGYVYEQFGFPYPAYQDTIRIQKNPTGLSAPVALSNSGPGAGCSSLVGPGATCFGGVDPGPLPGLERYPNPPGPPPAKSPKAGGVYEYWSLWPAPAHNSELNHLYYNPRINYDPPVDSAGNPYPQMSAANTANWTHVPADPWAPTIKYVDLTAQVTIGMWCNSDWSIGHENESAYCRTNGTGAGAATSSTATANGDYRYPWAPPGINPDDGVQPTTAKSIAFSKVAFNIATHTYNLQPAWATARDPKYFYENDNILWCDPTNALFPARGTISTGTCNAAPPTLQHCVDYVPQSCTGGAQAHCAGQIPQTCGGGVGQTCQVAPNVCGGLVGQICVASPAETCSGPIPQSCGPITPQTCDGSADATCSGLGHENCNGAGPQICNIPPPVCVAPLPTCGSYEPLGCDATCHPGDPECACEFIPCDNKCSTNPSQSCTAASDCPAPGTCSGSGLFCDAVTPCAILTGTCDHGGACATSNDCPIRGTCMGNACNPGDTCHQDGHCSSSGLSCAAPGTCADTRHCTLDPGQECTADAQCLDHNGFCSIHNATPCFNDGQCFQSARCSGSGSACTTVGSNAECPDLGGVCTVDFTACTTNGDCSPLAGHCSTVGNICHGAADCPDQNQHCSSSGLPCAGACPTLPGACDAGTTPVGGCLDDSVCQILGAHCSVDIGTACSYLATDCPAQLGYCSGDASHTPVCVDDSPCLPIPSPGTCDGFSSIVCTANSDCPSVGSDPAAAVCSDLLTGSSMFLNGNFEVPLTGVAAYVAVNHSYEVRPAEAGQGWTYVGGAGVQIFGGDWGAANSFDGSQTAFLNDISSMAQALVLPAGTYTVNLVAARRSYSCISPGNCGGYGLLNPVQFSVDGVLVGTISPADTNFSGFSFTVNIATAGAHVFRFASTNATNPDVSTFLDAITIGAGFSIPTLRYDADHAGVVCRHNNRDYGAGAGAFDYPNAQYNTPVTGGTGADACTASPRYASVARHYWKTGVEWCDTAISSPGDEWLGYGQQGTCQDSSDSAHSTPRFYQFGSEPGCTVADCPPTGIAPSAAYLDNYATPAFQRMDMTGLLNPNFMHTFLDDSHTLQIVTRTFDGATPAESEMINYANWFAYYRTRITALKTVTSLVFKDVDSQYRVGFHTLYLDPSTHNVAKFLNVDDFAGAQPGLFYADLFAVTLPLGQETPTLDAMVRIGEYYHTGNVAGLPGSANPIVLSCQKNWHVLFTDGYTNQPGLPTLTPPVGDTDLTIPPYPNAVGDPIIGLAPGGPWPSLYQEDTAFPTSNSLSDYAMFYWVTDLNAMPNNVPTCPSPRSVSCPDPANWQHVNFAAIALGTSGKLSASSTSATEALLATGALKWPQPTPSVNRPDSSGVDDLWHAAINSRGGFVNAETPDEVRLGLGQLLLAALNSAGTRTGVGFVSNTFSSTAKFFYRPQFTAGWGGSLAKIAFDPQTGVPGALQWDAADRLTAQLAVTVAHPTPWITERKIVTMTPAGAKVPFLWASLSASQQDSLAPGKPARGQTVLEFLRGNRSKEGTKLGQLRKRTTVLGDIDDSSPVFVGAPNWPYTDDNDAGYSAFSTGAASTRAARIYVGANDGMLHAFDDATGNETWAYVPTPLYRPDTTGLGGLAYQDGALPPFRHHFYVDSTPRVVDVDFNAPAGDQWHSILVAGMGKGGNRYYALDVTHPVDAGVTEDASVANVLWEFPPPGDTTTDMGYTYGKPFIAKTRAFGGEWLVIVPSGYNNTSGKGKLYFLRASDGHLEMTLSTGYGSAGTPSGLAHAAGYTKDYRNQLVEQIYAGDLFGNFWRFDVSDANPGNWTVGLMARLVDSFGAAQPVTTPPEIKVDPDNGVDRWVFVGTGRLLDDSDLTTPATPQQQTLYALRDGTDSTPVTPLPATPLSRTDLALLPRNAAANKFGLAAKPDKGWYDDLPTSPNQRIIVPPAGAGGVIGYVGTEPQDDPCLTGLPATIYARAYSTGQSLLLDTDDATILPYIHSDVGGVGVAIVAFESASGAAGLDVRVAITGFDGSVTFHKTKPTSSSSKYRMSWRLLGQ